MTQQFLEWIEDAKHIVIVVPKNPDADSLGSASALYSYMLQKHKKVSFFCPSDSIKRHYTFIPWVEKIRKNLPSNAELLIACGVDSIEKLGIVQEYPLVNIDNRTSNRYYGDLDIVDSLAISVTQVVYGVLQDLKAKINAKMATALYAGLFEKSDSFQNPQVDGMTFAFAKELLDKGALHANVVKYLQKYSTLSQLRLVGKMLESMRLIANGHVAIFHLDQSVLSACGAELEDAYEALERSLALPTVEVSVAIVQTSIGGFVVLLGSDAFDVEKIAVAYGGSGTKKFAMCALDGTLSVQEVEKKILQEVKKIEKKEK